MRRMNPDSKPETRNAKPRTTPTEPLAEPPAGIRRFSDEETMLVAKRWHELSAEGLTDWGICTAIAAETGRGAKSIESKLRELRKKGAIGGNPNKQDKDSGRTDEIISIRNELAEKGMCDGAISARIAKITGREKGSVRTTICALVRDGLLQPNQNNQREASRGELRTLLARREKLASIGLNDTSISRVVAAELGERNVNSIRRRLWLMVRDGDLERNCNEAHLSQQMESMLLRRAELMADGMGDAEISEKIANERGNNPRTLSFLVWRAVHQGGCRENPNNK